MGNVKKNRIIIYLFLAYILLMSFTGYLAFIYEVYNPAHDPEVYEPIASIEDQELRKSLIENLKVESDTYRKTKELAVTSFSLILGSFIGFLGTLAVTNRKTKTPNRVDGRQL